MSWLSQAIRWLSRTPESDFYPWPCVIVGHVWSQWDWIGRWKPDSYCERRCLRCGKKEYLFRNPEED